MESFFCILLKTQMMKKTLTLSMIWMLSFSAFSQSTDTVSVMVYNLLKFPQVNASRVSLLKNIVQESLPDILMVCELTSSSGGSAVLNDCLNQNGISYYDKSNYVPGTDTENMLYYNTNKLVLMEQNVISTDLRDINEYVLYYKSIDIATTIDTTFFYAYMCHLKAGQTETALRNEMAQDLKEYMATRSQIENVLLGGDFNVYGSSEPVWNTILSGAGVDLVDPIDTPGDWHVDWGYADIHTQSTRTTEFDGGAYGGMDDRFDLIFISPDLQNWGNQAKYIDGTYWAYGQDGNHYNDALTDAPANTSLPANIIQDLHDMSDHLPVYMEVEVQTSFNGIHDLNYGLSAYYNSYSESINFQFSKETFQAGSFSVFDLSGKKVISNVLIEDDNTISVKLLESGLYILKGNDIPFSYKFIR
ncbi:MAG: exonuclease III [Arenicella sp.]|jgi:exonuclease III